MLSHSLDEHKSSSKLSKYPHGRSRSRSRSTEITNHIKQKSNERSSERSKRRRSGWDIKSSGDTKDISNTTNDVQIVTNTTPIKEISSPVIIPNVIPESPLSSNRNYLMISPDITRTPQLVTTPTLTINPIQNKAFCRIYVGSLDYHLNEAEIKQVFQAFGTIVAIDLPKEGNRSKGFCFIEFSTPESAEMALKTMQGFVLKGRAIKVGRPAAVSNTSTLSPSPPGQTMSVAQANAMSAAALLAAKNASSLLSASNVDINVIVEKAGGTAAVGAAAVAALSSAAIMSSLANNGNSINIIQSFPNRIYVGNVPITMNVEDVKKIFGIFGPMNFCQLIPSSDTPGVHRGYGFVEYTDPAHAKLAIDAMNGFDIGGKFLKVNYATALRSNVNLTSLLSMNPNLSETSPGSTSALSRPCEDPTNSCGIINNGGSSVVSIISPMNSISNNLGQNSSIHLGQNPCDDTYISNSLLSNYSSQLITYSNANTSSTCITSSSDSSRHSRIILLKNMVTVDEVDEELKDEVQEECSQYGKIESVTIIPEFSDVKIFVCFEDAKSAQNAIPNLNDRWFGGKQINCIPYDENAFLCHDYTL